MMQTNNSNEEKNYLRLRLRMASSVVNRLLFSFSSSSSSSSSEREGNHVAPKTVGFIGKPWLCYATCVCTATIQWTRPPKTPKCPLQSKKTEKPLKGFQIKMTVSVSVFLRVSEKVESSSESPTKSSIDRVSLFPSKFQSYCFLKLLPLNTPSLFLSILISLLLSPFSFPHSAIFSR